jgi:hypothetical protein
MDNGAATSISRTMEDLKTTPIRINIYLNLSQQEAHRATDDQCHLIPTIHKYDAERDDYDYANHRRNSKWHPHPTSGCRY